MYVKTLNILVVFFSPSFIYVSHHHFDECFTENTGYVTSNLKLYNQPQSPNMQKSHVSMETELLIPQYYLKADQQNLGLPEMQF